MCNANRCILIQAIVVCNILHTFSKWTVGRFAHMLLETNLGSNGPSATMLFVIIQLPVYVVLFEEVWVRTCISQPIKMSQQLARASSRKRESAFLQCLHIFQPVSFRSALAVIPLESNTSLLESNHHHVSDHRLQVCLSQRGGQEKKHVFHLNSCPRGLASFFPARLAISSAEPPERAQTLVSKALETLGERPPGDLRICALTLFSH